MKGAVSNKKKIVKVVLCSVLCTLLLLVIVFESILLVQKYIKKAPVPMIFGYASLVVATGSMNGTIDQGDMIIVKKTNDYSLGDIVTYVEKGSNTPVTHRLVNYGQEQGTFITKGDANNTADTLPITEEQIAGKVVLVIPKLGIVFDWFLTGGGIIYIAAMIIVIVCAVIMWKKTAPNNDVQPTQDHTTKE